VNWYKITVEISNPRRPSWSPREFDIGYGIPRIDFSR
jgi:hypothetical protein